MEPVNGVWFTDYQFIQYDLYASYTFTFILHISETRTCVFGLKKYFVYPYSVQRRLTVSFLFCSYYHLLFNKSTNLYFRLPVIALLLEALDERVDGVARFATPPHAVLAVFKAVDLQHQLFLCTRCKRKIVSL